MPKPKRQPKNFFQYFVDEYILFRRDFYYVLEIAPERVVDSLCDLSNEDKTSLVYEPKNRLIVPDIVQTSNGWDFEIIAQQATNNGYNNSATAQGTINNDDSLTYLEGNITVKGWQFWGTALGLLVIGIIFVFIGMMMSYSFETMIFGISFLYLAILGILWMQMYEDRNYLFALIEEAVETMQVNSDEENNSEEKSQDEQAKA